MGEQSRKKTKRLNRVGRKDAPVSMMTSAGRNDGVHLFRVLWGPTGKEALAHDLLS